MQIRSFYNWKEFGVDLGAQRAILLSEPPPLPLSTTLDKFIELFPDETVLREALVLLWSQVPGVSGVRLLHSGLEHGKDLIFYYAGPASESMLCACVVKNDKISGSASASLGAMTVVNQARQALGNPYINPKGGEER